MTRSSWSSGTSARRHEDGDGRPAGGVHPGARKPSRRWRRGRLALRVRAGRRTLAARLGVLDVATLLHEALLVACLRRPDDSVTVVREAGDFALECLSPFEMAHRAVREANAALRGLNDHLEEQTRRISRELHDQAGQLLASVYLALDDLARDVPGDVGERLLAVKGLLDRIEGAAPAAVPRAPAPDSRRPRAGRGARRFSSRGFAARHALEIRVHGQQRRAASRTHRDRALSHRPGSPERCSQARAGRHRDDCRQPRCPARVLFGADDGIGFDPQATRVGDHGIGLMGIRERLTPLGGVLSIASAPGIGTELRVTIPLGR